MDLKPRVKFFFYVRFKTQTSFRCILRFFLSRNHTLHKRRAVPTALITIGVIDPCTGLTDDLW